MTLNRSIGFIGLTFIAVGGVIGSGWIFGPLITAKLAGPASIVSWALGGVGMLILALSFAEISSLIPVAGGIARLPMFSHGKFTAMLMGWTAWLGYNTAAPIETIAALDYLAAYFPWLQAASGEQNALSLAGMAVAAGVLVFFTVLNAFGVQAFAKANTSITWFKIAIPSVIALSLLYLQFEPDNFTEYGGFMPFGWTGVFSAISTGGIIFSLIGFRHAIDMAGETKKPQIVIPLALATSLLLCLFIYEILQVAFVGALSPEHLANGWDKIKFSNNLGPLAGVIVGLGVGWLTVVLYAGAVVGPLGAGLISTGSNGRLAYAMTENDLFPSWLGRLSANKVPMRAMGLNLLVGFYVVFFMKFEEAVALNSAAIILSFSIGPIAVYTFRKQLADRPRKFQLPCVQLMGILGLWVASLVIYWSGWHVFRVMFISFIIGIVMFGVHVIAKKEHWKEQQIDHAFWVFPYLFGLGWISYLGHYGGGLMVIDFPLDVILVLALSVIIFYLAAASAMSVPQARAYFEEARCHHETQHKLTVYPEKTPLIVACDEEAECEIIEPKGH
ncbi:MAG: APC family permease [Cellvibrionales bacterium]|nr:APC family permease [Cellvibrionales bacterium]